MYYTTAIDCVKKSLTIDPLLFLLLLAFFLLRAFFFSRRPFFFFREQAETPPPLLRPLDDDDDEDKLALPALAPHRATKAALFRSISDFVTDLHPTFFPRLEEGCLPPSGAVFAALACRAVCTRVAPAAVVISRDAPCCVAHGRRRHGHGALRLWRQHPHASVTPLVGIAALRRPISSGSERRNLRFHHDAGFPFFALESLHLDDATRKTKCAIQWRKMSKRLTDIHLPQCRRSTVLYTVTSDL